MLGGKYSSKFEARVHLGLLAIIFMLISLNFISNYINYSLRSMQSKATANRLYSSAFAISRTISDHIPNPPESTLTDYKVRYNLSGLLVIASQPDDDTPESRRKWFKDFVHRLPTDQVPDVARKILGSSFATMTRGENEEYFLVYPMLSRGTKYLLIVSVNSPELAYLDDTSTIVLSITIFSSLLIFSAYYFLARLIFKPFRELRKQAVESGRVVLDSDNEAEAMVDDYRKIIEQLKEQEQKLKRRADSLEQFNNYLLRSSSAGIITFDRESRMLSINEAAANLLKIDAAEYIGGSVEHLFIKSSSIAKALEKVIIERNNHPYDETEIELNNGMRTTIGFSVSTVSDDHQQPIGASIIITDVNELSKLREELEAKNRLAALGEMSGGLAHQLRNSMGTIAGFCNLLRKQLSDDDRGREYLHELFGEVKETELLVKRFLSFARPLEYQPDEIDLDQVINEIIDSQISSAGKAGVRIRFVKDEHSKKSEEKVIVLADGLLFRQALCNLIDNAIAACEPGKGLVELSYKSEEEKVIISITDNGIGIKSDDLNRIFTPFFSSKPSGTGLGLPLAAKIIDLHGGSISVDSKEGFGTTFVVSLPARTPEVKIQSV